MHNFQDLTGQKFGLVTVIKRGGATHHGAVMWLAVCECGKAKWFRSNNLKNHPPKTHNTCHRGFDFVVDEPRTAVYVK